MKPPTGGFLPSRAGQRQPRNIFSDAPRHSAVVICGDLGGSRQNSAVQPLTSKKSGPAAQNARFSPDALRPITG
jgi:hypothetical protein